MIVQRREVQPFKTIQTKHRAIYGFIRTKHGRITCSHNRKVKLTRMTNVFKVKGVVGPGRVSKGKLEPEFSVWF